MRIHIYLSLAGAICLSAANPVPAVSGVDEGPISLFKRVGVCESRLYPDLEELDWDYIQADGMEGILKYDDNDELLPDQLSKRTLVGLPGVVVKIVGRAALVQFLRSFRTTSAVSKARSTYYLCFGDNLFFKGPSFDSGPKLSVKHPSVNAFMPGEAELCVLKGSELTDAQRAMGQTEHVIEVVWVRDWLNELHKKYPEVALEIVKGPLKIWTGYKKHGGKFATQVLVIDALMYNIGSKTDGTAVMSILERDINIAKGNMFSENAWPGEDMWKPESKYKPTHTLLFDKIRDIAFASQYVLHQDTRTKAQDRMKVLLRTLITYEGLTKLKVDGGKCPNVAEDFLAYVRQRFKSYSTHLPKTYEGNLAKWDTEKDKLKGCDPTEVTKMTGILKTLTPKTLDVDSYMPMSLLEGLEAIPQVPPK